MEKKQTGGTADSAMSNDPMIGGTMASSMAKGGVIGDNVIIMDEKSLMNNKAGVIVGEDGNFWLVKTLNGTGLVRKSKVKVIEEYANGGGVSSFMSKAKSLGKMGLSKTKEAYGKTKEYAKGKVHDQKKKIALDVIYDAKENLPINRDEIKALDKAFSVVENKYAKGGGVGSESEVATYFKTLDYSKLPKQFEQYIKEEILTDDNLQYLSPREPIFIELKDKIESFGAARKPETSESSEKAKIEKEIADLEGIRDFVEGEELEKTNKEIEDLQGLLMVI